MPKETNFPKVALSTLFVSSEKTCREAKLEASLSDSTPGKIGPVKRSQAGDSVPNAKL